MGSLINSDTVPSTYSSVSLGALAAVAVALMPGIMAPGSGGLATVDALSSRQHLFEASAASVTLSYVKARSSDEQIAYVRQVIGISITDIADLLGVTRPTVYTWMKGGEMRAEHASKLNNLTAVVEKLESEGVSPLSKLVKRRLSAGISLYELLKSEQHISSHVLQEMAALADTERRQRERNKGGQYLRTTAEVAFTEGVAGYVQDA